MLLQECSSDSSSGNGSMHTKKIIFLKSKASQKNMKKERKLSMQMKIPHSKWEMKKKCINYLQMCKIVFMPSFRSNTTTA